MTGLGTLPARFIDPACQPPRFIRLALLAISGWGLVALISAAFAVADVDQTWLARGLLAIGLLLLVPWDRKRRPTQNHLLADLALLLVIVAARGLLIVDAPATAYDEFAHWLPNTRHLVEEARYWVWPASTGMSARPSYPNASLVVSLLFSQLAGPEVEAPFKTFVVILLASYGGVLADLAAGRWFADAAPPWERRVLLTAL